MQVNINSVHIFSTFYQFQTTSMLFILRRVMFEDFVP